MNIITVTSPGQLNEKPTAAFKAWYQAVAPDYPNLPVLMDTQGQLIKQLGIQVYPSWAILDKHGNVLKVVKGNLSPQQMQALAENASNDFAELKNTEVKPNSNRLNQKTPVIQQTRSQLDQPKAYYQADGKTPIRTQSIYLAGGCFWGVEDAFQKITGVCEAVSGYTGGHTVNPSYEDVCRGDTGHAEAVLVRFDPARVSYEQISRRFFEIHDPTQLNRQGPDWGEQYRSAVFYENAEQKAVAQKLVARLQELGYKVATQLAPAGPFYAAEPYHQDFTRRTGRGACHMSVPRFSQRADGTPVDADIGLKKP